MGSEQTAQAWVNAGKVKSVEEYYQKVGITPEETATPIIETPKPKRRRTTRKSL
jgi:hypothetical protein